MFDELIYILSKFGVLVVYVVDNNIVCVIWYLDDLNDEYIKYKIYGMWYLFYKKNDGNLIK